MKKIAYAVIVQVVVAMGVTGQTADRINRESEGYSFSAIKGWKQASNAEGVTFANRDKTIIVVVKSHNYKDFAAFSADANLVRDGLELVGKPQDIKDGTTFRTVKRSPQGMAVIDTAVLFSPTGGVVVVAISDEANAATGFATGLAVAGSVVFFQPKVGQAATQIKALLGGEKLLYMYTGNGYSERKDIVLCSSGTFYQTTGMGGFTTNNVDGPSFAATGGKRGTWAISPTGSKLMMSFQNGGIVEYTLSARRAGNEIGMNGQRYFVQEQNVCR